MFMQVKTRTLKVTYSRRDTGVPRNLNFPNLLDNYVSVLANYLGLEESPDTEDPSIIHSGTCNSNIYVSLHLTDAGTLGLRYMLTELPKHDTGVLQHLQDTIPLLP